MDSAGKAGGCKKSVTRRQAADDLSTDQLRKLLAERRRSEHQARLEQYRRSGRLVPLEKPGDPQVAESGSGEWARPYPAGRMQPRKTWFDYLLLVIEIAAVAGLAYVIFTGANILRNLNNEATISLVQPTLTPTPIIQAIVLPSGHTPPDSTGGVSFNEAEIPQHLRPLMQNFASLPLPTPGPEHAVRIQIPAISVDAPVVQGDGWEQLKKGVGQMVNTPNPGQNGNLVLSAHNDIFGQIFQHLDKLEEGDEVILYTSQRAYVYKVNQTRVVEPTTVEVLENTREPIVTLISCYPYLVDNQRIVVTAYLEENQ